MSLGRKGLGPRAVGLKRAGRRGIGAVLAPLLVGGALVAATPAAAGAATAAAPTGVEAAAPAAVSAAAVPGSWLFRGAGWGHGIGMSQWGAMEMAKDGYSAKQILAHYYTGTSYSEVTDTAAVNVNLRNKVTSTTIAPLAKGSSAAGPMTISVKDADGTSRTTTGPAESSMKVTRSGAELKIACSTCEPIQSMEGAEVSVTWPSSTTLLSVDGARYESGRVIVTPTPTAATSKTLEVVNRVRVHDQYLDFIREVPWSWPAAALEAQAAAARGYALARVGTPSTSCNCNLYDDTRSQVYGGYPTSSVDLSYLPRWKAAVRASGSSSTGYVAQYQGKTISAYYASSTGGRTQNNEDVWGGTPVPYLRSVDDPWSLRASNPRRSWTKTVSQSTLGSAFGISSIVRLDLRNRTDGTGVADATATSSSGATRTITGEQLRSRLGLNSTWVSKVTQRIGGSDRYEVAASVAQQVSSSASTAVLTSGESRAVFDASVSGPLAGTVSGPLLLTRKGSLPPATLAELDRRKASLRTVLVVGGAASVSDAVVKSLASRGLSVTRLGGADRYDVARNVAAEIHSRRSVSSVVVAGGAAMADALGASGPAAATGRPILLTRPDALPAATSAALGQLGATSAQVVGGAASVSDAVVNGLKDADLSVTRLGGADRYEVAAAVAGYYRTLVPNTQDIVLTSGLDEAMADSLAAGSLKRIIVLTKKGTVPESTFAALQRSPLLQSVTAVGGTASVPSSALTAASRS